jgi:hypothetical protein
MMTRVAVIREPRRSHASVDSQNRKAGALEEGHLRPRQKARTERRLLAQSRRPPAAIGSY